MARQASMTKPFKPTIAQLCTIAELSHAKVPIEAIAKAVKLSPRAFKDWKARLANAVANEAAKPAPVALVEPIELVNRGPKEDIERPDCGLFQIARGEKPSRPDD
jgi:hypothetical protein